MHVQRGVTLVEVLVTMVILAIGLLGLVGLEVRVQVLQVEAYQRAQALMLLNDMAGRMANNTNHIGAYVTGPTSPLGGSTACPAAPTDPTLDTYREDADANEWCNALQGAGEAQGASSVGAMVGGRGCIEDLGNGTFLVTVAWQGLIPISPPPAGVACAKNAYNGAAGSACVGDACRRVITTVVQVATLT